MNSDRLIECRFGIHNTQLRKMDVEVTIPFVIDWLGANTAVLNSLSVAVVFVPTYSCECKNTRNEERIPHSNYALDFIIDRRIMGHYSLDVRTSSKSREVRILRFKGTIYFPETGKRLIYYIPSLFTRNIYRYLMDSGNGEDFYSLLSLDLFRFLKSNDIDSYFTSDRDELFELASKT